MVQKSIAEQAHAHYDRGVPFEIPLPTRSLYFLLETSARYYPNNIAIDFFGRTWTYEKLLREVNQAAQVLYQIGVRKGDTVALAMPNCPQHFVAFYALMRLGAVAAEHNPLAPDAQIAGQLERNGAKVAIVWEKCASSYTQIVEDGGTVFSVNLSASMPAKYRFALNLPVNKARKKRAQVRADVPAEYLSWDNEVANSRLLAATVPHAEVDDIAVILHTGGTNGVPKSVPLTHLNLGANANQNIFWVWKLHEGAETFWSLLPYFHAFGLTFFLICSVALSSTQVMLPQFDVDAALDAHKRRPISFFVGVPPMFDRLAKAARKRGDDLTSIKFAISGGMPLSREIAELWEHTTTHYIIEGYGMSETAPTMCGSPLTPERRHSSLGLPFPSTEIRLVDPANPSMDVEDGQPGEILVKGPQVFSGYLDAPEENQRVFHDGWLRTGDIARNEDGFLVMADRLKEMIITSGFNVFPSEVEAVFNQMEEIESCTAVGISDPESGEKVALAIVPAEEQEGRLTLADIRAFGEAHLPHYALPKIVELFESLPVSQLGKVLRHTVRDQITQRQGKPKA
ncbi:AMP-binding protein [Boudabousia marimammalium]|uniref:AMP-binding protein n=1 Tax=Boudabousia marimammalium TaxID=156892 RepID=UPI000A42298A|nr:AMP-binding protein [Boudabousia marimammalium]